MSELRSRGKSYSEISRELGLTKSTVAYHARRLGLAADDRCARRYDWDAIRTAYETGLSARECARAFGFNMSCWYDAVQRGEIVPRSPRIPLESLLVVGRAATNRSHLKQRLIEAGLKEDRCERCGLTAWRGEPLSMQLHHRNGDGLDNRLENLELLCPNCHAQTDTYGGRNGHRRNARFTGEGPP